MSYAQAPRKLKKPLRVIVACAVTLCVLAVPLLWPHIDLAVSGLFYHARDGFFLSNALVLDDLHYIAYAGARLIGLFLLLMTVIAFSRRVPVLGLDAKAWLFLFLGLLIGPALIANGLFKDNWGRARPREVMEFGGDKHFSSALIPTDECQRNCSFVAGDGAFGFYLPCIAYVVPRRRSRRYFWGGMGLGGLFAFGRLAGGAHFLSDIVYAAFFMQLVLAMLHSVMYGWKETQICWGIWFSLARKSKT